MIKIPHERRSHQMPLVLQSKNPSGFHNWACMSMVVRECNDTKRFFFKKFDFFKKKLVSEAPNWEPIGKMKMEVCKIKRAKNMFGRILSDFIQ